MKCIHVCSIPLTLCLGTGIAVAGGPPNDFCQDATVVPGNTVTYNPSIVNTTTATTELCGALESCEAGGGGTTNSVWYRYTPDPGFSGTIVITTFGSTYDTVLSVFDGCGQFNPATLSCLAPNQLACNDDLILGGQTSEISMPVVENQTYVIKVASRSALGGGGLLDFNVRWIPANDQCANATFVDSGSYNPPLLDTVHATTDLCEAQEDCEFNNIGVSNTVWYEFVPTANGTVTIDTDGSTYDTVLSIFDGCGFFVGVDQPCDLPNQLICDDDSGVGTQSQILDFPVQACQSYLIKVADYNTAAGGGSLDFNLVFTESCREDINEDGSVDVVDLLSLLAKWGVCD